MMMLSSTLLGCIMSPIANGYGIETVYLIGMNEESKKGIAMMNEKRMKIKI